MEVPYLFVSFLLLLASYFFTLHFLRKLSNLPPTVFPALPIIGNLYLLKPPVYRNSAIYGPILLLRLGSHRVLLIPSPSAAEECFTKNDIVFVNRPHMLFGKIIGNNYTSLVWSPYGDNWRNLRRIASIEFLSIHRLIRKLLSHSSSNSSVDFKSVFYELTLNVMMRMISGKRYFGGDIPEVEEEGKRFREILDETFLLAGAANVGDYLPILSWFGVKGLEKKLIALRDKRDAIFQGLIEQLRKSKGENNKKTMIGVLLSLQESDPKYYTDEVIRSLVLVRSEWVEGLSLRRVLLDHRSVAGWQRVFPGRILKWVVTCCVGALHGMNSSLLTFSFNYMENVTCCRRYKGVLSR